jgi:hypothetical protein
MFHFTCFNVEDPNDPSVGLVDGQLSIPGNLLRREVFDPVVAEVCDAVSGFVHLSHLFDLRRYYNSSRTKHGRSIKGSMLCYWWEVLQEVNI